MTTTNSNTTTNTNHLETLLNHAAISGMISAAPALAAAAAAARLERASAFKAAAATTATRAATSSASSPSHADSGGNAPILRANWSASVPTQDTTYNAPLAMRQVLAASIQCGGHILMTGAAGTGKTEAARDAAARLARAFFVVDCAAMRDATDWFGSQTLSAGRVAWQDSVLVSAMQTQDCVILLDEVNRAHTASHGGLLSMLARQRAIQFPQRSEPIEMASGVVFVATANVGSSEVGVGAMSLPFVDRFTVVPTDYLSKSEETALILARNPRCPSDIVDHLIELGAHTRRAEWQDSVGGTALSTRALLEAARLAVALMDGGSPTNLAARSLIARQTAEVIGGSTSPRQQLAAFAARCAGGAA